MPDADRIGAGIDCARALRAGLASTCSKRRSAPTRYSLEHKEAFGTCSSRDPKWIGILVGSTVAPDFAKRFSDGYQTVVDGIPVAALTLQRFRGSDVPVPVKTDASFCGLASRNCLRATGKSLS
jgi:hypothetical protein